jgi:hypothetical protein
MRLAELGLEGDVVKTCILATHRRPTVKRRTV